MDRREQIETHSNYTYYSYITYMLKLQLVMFCAFMASGRNLMA